MGEDKAAWAERVALLMPYRVNAELITLCGNRKVKFMHCLPSFHDRSTPTGEAFYQEHGLNGVEVAREVFNGSHSIVFDQAENRMHTIKALLVSTLVEKTPEMEDALDPLV